MKKIILSAAFAMAIVVAFAQSKTIDLNDIWGTYAFYPKGASGFDFMKDGKQFLKNDVNRSVGSSLNSYNLATGEKTGTLLTANDIKGEWSSYELNGDETQILYSQDEEPLYRHSSKANFFIYKIKDKTVKSVSGGGKQRLATFNPQGDKVAFIRDNNLYIKDLTTNAETAVTTDGKANSIINGAADWVYEEEFSMDRAFYWSPDGKYIGYLRFDETKVREVTLTLYNQQLYPEYTSFKYPKAGEANSIVSCAIYNVAQGTTVAVTLPPYSTDCYLPKIQWSPTYQLCLMRMNRHQSELTAYLVSPTDGSASLLFEEKNKYYVDIAPGVSVSDNLKFLKDGKHFLWLSEQDGYNHIYLYDTKGKATQLTKGKWDVSNVYGVDEKRGVVYYQAAEIAPNQRQVYSIGLDGKNKKTLLAAEGWNDAEFSSTFDYLVGKHSTANMPADIAVYDATGKKLREIETNEKLRTKMKEYDLAKVEFFTFKTSENIELSAWMMKPTNFDATKKYPVLMHVYGGPNNQQVTDNWNAFDYWWYQMLAQQGYIIVTVDGRGTGAKGEEFKKCTYKQLGKLETIDQIEGAKWLGKQPYVDAARIGIWGWSFGGYMSLLCILKGNDVFKTAIAVAPVTNWKWYDNIYTERFMQTPEENPKGYEENSPINFAEQLKGNLLLMHGDADDNVHYQNSAEMAAALINANKQYDTYVYPNKNHSIAGGVTRLHLYTKMTNFLKAKL